MGLTGCIHNLNIHMLAMLDVGNFTAAQRWIWIQCTYLVQYTTTEVKTTSDICNWQTESNYILDFTNMLAGL